jgi:hypothetical protein
LKIALPWIFGKPLIISIYAVLLVLLRQGFKVVQQAGAILNAEGADQAVWDEGDGFAFLSLGKGWLLWLAQTLPQDTLVAGPERGQRQRSMIG